MRRLEMSSQLLESERQKEPQKNPLLKNQHFHSFQTLHWCAVTLAVWLLSTALTFHKGSPVNLISDSICGAAIIILAVVGLVKKSQKCNTVIQFATALIAAWLMFAPLVTWTKSALVYEIDNLVAILLVVIYWIAPKFHDKQSGAAEIPPGWDYNPSSWGQRVPLIALALIGYFIARYLACCQLGYVGPAWDPV